MTGAKINSTAHIFIREESCLCNEWRESEADRRTCIDLLHVKDVTYFRSLCNPQTYTVQTLLEVQHTTWGLKHESWHFRFCQDGNEDVTVFWDLTRRHLCGIIHRRFRGTCRLHHQLRQLIPPKCQYIYTTLHGVICQKIIFMRQDLRCALNS